MEMQRIQPSDISEHDAVLDVRHHVGHAQIRGALRYDPKALISEEHVTLPLPLESRVVLHTDRDEDPSIISERLHQMGCNNVVALDATMDEIRDAGVPVEGPTIEQPIPEHPSSGIPRL